MRVQSVYVAGGEVYEVRDRCDQCDCSDCCESECVVGRGAGAPSVVTGRASTEAERSGGAAAGGSWSTSCVRD
jgi:hypothetical protein